MKASQLTALLARRPTAGDRALNRSSSHHGWLQSTASACVCGAAAIAGSGCSPLHHVNTADRDAYSILDRHSDIDPVSAPADHSVLPGPESRLFDPTPVEAPLLPDPTPRLHTYAIPYYLGPHPASRQTLQATADSHPTAGASQGGGRRGAAVMIQAATSSNHSPPSLMLRTRLHPHAEIRGEDDELDIFPVTIPHSAWESIPVECRKRMFEFESLRTAYAQAYESLPPDSEQDDSPRLGLGHILHLALLNSREYQAQKDQLYRVALRLSLEQYDYQLKFAPFGNRTGARYENRDSSTSSRQLFDVPSAAQLEGLMTTGTDFVARFANTVLLTFNGPDGLAADISSELLFDFTHSVFQNDVRFERLTQAERNVAYAARNFARFRRTFYLQLAAQYYNLLRTYRQVEIDAQNYLSLVRVYSERAIELAEGEAARVQIDQVEQNALAGRSSLIGTCNNLENALDLLKIRMGLPTELPFNLDLSELEYLTLSDEASVNLELLRRVHDRLASELAPQDHDEVTALNLAAELVARMRDSVRLRRRLEGLPAGSTFREQTGESAPSIDREDKPSMDVETLGLLQAWLEVSERRVRVQRHLTQLQASRGGDPKQDIMAPELWADYVRLVLLLLVQEQDLAIGLGVSPQELQGIEQSRLGLAARLSDYNALVDDVIGNVQIDRLDVLRRTAETLAADAARAADAAHSVTLARAQELGLRFDETTQQTMARLQNEVNVLFAGADEILPAIDLNMEDVALAALAGRLDLANARGALFDEWRGTKLAADDLKSILDLRARQRLITQNQTNRPVEFDFDESRTELALAVDTPLNRRAQRNIYREQLLNYQAVRRSVMALEDAIKQDIRAALRSIELSREQYALGIASAALAYERVISTELQLRLGVPGVVARDYLEAQNAYANALSAVASRRLGYIIGRIGLFTDLEQLEIDASGRWAALHDASQLPKLDIGLAQDLGYGELPRPLRYSQEMIERSQQYWTIDGTPATPQEIPDPCEEGLE